MTKFTRGKNPNSGFKKGYTPWNKGKKCPSISRKGRSPWNKGLKGFRAGEKRPYMSIKGEAHWSYKGEDIQYSPLHQWVRKELGKAYKCSHCGKIGYGRQMHWANIDHSYKRNLSNWISLCAKCHGKYDTENGLRKHIINI